MVRQTIAFVSGVNKNQGRPFYECLKKEKTTLAQLADSDNQTCIDFVKSLGFFVSSQQLHFPNFSSLNYPWTFFRHPENDNYRNVDSYSLISLREKLASKLNMMGTGCP